MRLGSLEMGPEASPVTFLRGVSEPGWLGSPGCQTFSPEEVLPTHPWPHRKPDRSQVPSCPVWSWGEAAQAGKKEWTWAGAHRAAMEGSASQWTMGGSGGGEGLMQSQSLGRGLSWGCPLRSTHPHNHLGKGRREVHGGPFQPEANVAASCPWEADVRQIHSPS